MNSEAKNDAAHSDAVRPLGISGTTVDATVVSDGCQVGGQSMAVIDAVPTPFKLSGDR